MLGASRMLTRLHVGDAGCQSASSGMMSGVLSRILTRLVVLFSPPGAVVVFRWERNLPRLQCLIYQGK